MSGTRQICDNCRSRNSIIFDRTEGIQVCTMCGHVADEAVLDEPLIQYPTGSIIAEGDIKEMDGTQGKLTDAGSMFNSTKAIVSYQQQERSSVQRKKYVSDTLKFKRASENSVAKKISSFANLTKSIKRRKENETQLQKDRNKHRGSAPVSRGVVVGSLDDIHYKNNLDLETQNAITPCPGELSRETLMYINMYVMGGWTGSASLGSFKPWVDAAYSRWKKYTSKKWTLLETLSDQICNSKNISDEDKRKFYRLRNPTESADLSRTCMFYTINIEEVWKPHRGVLKHLKHHRRKSLEYRGEFKGKLPKKSKKLPLLQSSSSAAITDSSSCSTTEPPSPSPSLWS